MIYLALVLVGLVQTALVLRPLRAVLRRLDELELLVLGRNRQEGPPAAQKQAVEREKPRVPNQPAYL